MPTGKELRKALKNNDLTMETAAEKLQISRPTLYNWVNKAELSEDEIQNVKTKLGIDLELGARPFIEQRRENKLADEPYLVPFVDVPAQAGYKKAYQQRDYIATLTRHPILPDIDPAGAVWRYFQVDGSSMEPEIMAGDILLCSQVPREDWQDIKNHHTHVIVTDDNLWIKDVYRENDHEWIMLSQNPDTAPFLLNVEDIKQVWVMRRHIKGRAKKHRLYDMKDVRKQIGLSKKSEGNQADFQYRAAVNPSPFERLGDNS